MTTFKEEYTNENEETMTTEEMVKGVSDLLEGSYHLYNALKIKLVRRGFLMGLITALAVQSLATIVVMLIMMT